MTLSPTDSRNVKGLAGDAYPNFKVGPICCSPVCSRYADAGHHLFRRSLLGGPFDWVQLEDGTIVANKVPLCHSCHLLITDNMSRIKWLDGTFVWIDNTGILCGELSPQPPIHGKPTSVTRHSAPDGPASVPTCSECGRALPHKHDGPKEPKRRRKTWTVTVPDDVQEDGGLVLDTLVAEVARMFGHEDKVALRYFTICQAMALVLEHQTMFTSDMS